MQLRTLSDLVFRIREISSGRPDLLSVDNQGRRESLSTADFLRGIHSVTLALEAQGVCQGDRVAILSENRPEWHIVDFACQLLGAPSVPIDPSLSGEQVGFILRNSASRWVFFSGIEQRDLLLSLASTLTSPPECVAFESEAAVEGGVSITRLMGEGAPRLGEIPIERFRGRPKEFDPASLVYNVDVGAKRGLVDPSPRLLTHRDLVGQIADRDVSFTASPSDLLVSSLSLAQTLPRSLDLLCFYRGVPIHYAHENLQSILLRERPTHLIAAAEWYQEIYQSVSYQMQKERPWRRRVYRWAMEIGQRHAAASEAGFVGPWVALRRRLADDLIYQRVRQMFGGRIRYVITADKLLAEEVKRFFDVVGLPIFLCAEDSRGLSETTA